jgi:hypothetical protein
MSTSAELSRRVFTFQAPIGRGRSQEEWRRHAVEARAFTEEDVQKYNPYFWPALISNNRFDSHSTRMAVSSLRNYAAEAQAGVSYLYSHDNEEIVGHSMGGRFVGGQGDGVAHVDADFYAIPGMQLGTVSSDQVILAIDTRVLRYVSIGFYGGEWICSICGNDIWDFENCRHYPGYPAKIQADGETREEICTADVENAHLAEVSSVYKGSTPGAIITKAEHDAKHGLLTPGLRSLIERRCHVTLPEKRVAVPGHGDRAENVEEKRTMPDKNKPAAAGAAQEEGGAGEGDEQRAGGGAPAGALAIGPESVAAHREFVGALLAEAGLAEGGDEHSRLRQLLTRAADGEQYRTDLIAEALAEGVRAKGPTFDQETYRATLEGAPVATIKRMRDDWEREATKDLKPGRQTREDASETGARPRPSVPRSAHKIR